MTRRLDAVGLFYSADEIIAEEARQIDAAFNGGPIPQDGARGGRDLRLHVVGDASTLHGVRLLAEAAVRWRDRRGGKVWTYTHAWRGIPKDTWGEAVSVLASVELPEDIEIARERGYPAAIVVEAFPNGSKAYRLPGSDSKIVPCPAETGDAVCNQCRLCLDCDLLRAGKTIGFALHGQYRAIAEEKLVQLKLNSKCGRVDGDNPNP